MTLSNPFESEASRVRLTSGPCHPSVFQCQAPKKLTLMGSRYDAITFLSYLVPLYFFIWQLLGAIGVGAYLQSMRPDIALTNGLNPFW